MDKSRCSGQDLSNGSSGFGAISSERWVTLNGWPLIELVTRRLPTIWVPETDRSTALLCLIISNKNKYLVLNKKQRQQWIKIFVAHISIIVYIAIFYQGFLSNWHIVHKCIIFLIMFTRVYDDCLRTLFRIVWSITGLLYYKSNEINNV